MPDSPSAADDAVADAVDAARPVTPPTPPTPNTPLSASFYTRPSPSLNLTRSFNLHALGFSTSPLGPLGRRISFYGDDGDDDGDDYSDSSNDDGEFDDGRSTGTGNDGNNDPLAEDRKDVLIDRLNDVVRHVTSYSPSSPSHSNRASPAHSHNKKNASTTRAVHGSDENVLSSLHAHVDEMEAVLAAAEAAAAAAAAASPRHHTTGHRHYPWQAPERRSGASVSSVGEKSPLMRAPFLEAAPILIRNQASAFRRPGVSKVSLQQAIPPTNSKHDSISKTVAADCDALAGDLSNALAGLIKRSQESENIQHALLRQLAAANSRAGELEAQLKTLTATQDAREVQQQEQDWPSLGRAAQRGAAVYNTETSTETDNGDDGDQDGRLDDLDSELSFLRLQLRGIEVRCRSYVPDDADPELTESIENWKADWSALRARVEEERRSTTTIDNNKSMNDMNSTF